MKKKKNKRRKSGQGQRERWRVRLHLRLMQLSEEGGEEDFSVGPWEVCPAALLSCLHAEDLGEASALSVCGVEEERALNRKQETEKKQKGQAPDAGGAAAGEDARSLSTAWQAEGRTWEEKKKKRTRRKNGRLSAELPLVRRSRRKE